MFCVYHCVCTWWIHDHIHHGVHDTKSRLLNSPNLCNHSLHHTQFWAQACFCFFTQCKNSSHTRLFSFPWCWPWWDTSHVSLLGPEWNWTMNLYMTSIFNFAQWMSKDCSLLYIWKHCLLPDPCLWCSCLGCHQPSVSTHVTWYQCFPIEFAL